MHNEADELQPVRGLAGTPVGVRASRRDPTAQREPCAAQFGVQVSSWVNDAIRPKSRSRCQTGTLCSIAIEAIRQSTP